MDNGFRAKLDSFNKRLDLILEKYDGQLDLDDIEIIEDYFFTVKLSYLEEFREFFRDFLKTYGEPSKEKLEELLISVENVLDKYKQEISTEYNTPPLQAELFPSFKPPVLANIKKDVVISWISTAKIKEKYPHLLGLSLVGEKKTLSQLLDEVENWYKNLRGEDYANWIKVFLFAQAVKDQLRNDPDTIDLFEESNGIYRFTINVDKRFYDFFEKPTGNKNGYKYHTSKQKDKIIKWLEKNNAIIEFPIIATLPSKRKAIIPKAGKVFEFKKAIRDDGKQLLLFSIDTNVLDDEFKNYVSFSRADIDEINEAWERISPHYEKLSLNSYIDIPLRFYSVLKLLYNRNAIVTLKNGFVACLQQKTNENLDSDLGDLADRIQSTLKSRDRVRTGKTSKKPQAIKHIILETTFKIAVELKWLFNMPKYEKGIYKFTMNPGKFDKKETVKLLAGKKDS